MTTPYPQVSIPGTEMRALSSSFVDQEFRILVGLPETYSTSDKTYPVLYLLDGNPYFGTLETVRLGALYKLEFR